MVENLKDLSYPFLTKVDAVVWPEYALGDIDERDLAVAHEMAGGDRVFVASGSESRDGVEGNTAITFAGGEVVGRHIKNHPVHFFSDGVAGEVAEPVKTRFGKAGTPICFDCDHQDVVRKMTAAGAEFFLIPSLDAIHWSARQHEQHGMLFRHRAAENGRWLAVASSSGVTQIIDPRGHVRDRLPLMDEGTLVGEISRVRHRTLFQWGGWLIGPISMVLTSGTILWLGWRRASKSS
jgi:apolipoprotein N-acyltransferase